MNRVGRAGRDLCLGVAGLWLLAEAAHARVSVIPANAGIPPSPHDTLLVLGCPSRRDGRPSAAQRWRVDLAARNARANRCGSSVPSRKCWPEARVISTASQPDTL